MFAIIFLIKKVHTFNCFVMFSHSKSLWSALIKNKNTIKHATSHQGDTWSRFPLLEKRNWGRLLLPRSSAGSLPVNPHLTKALSCRHNVAHRKCVCMCLACFPVCFLFQHCSLAGEQFRPTESLRPPAHVFERHLFILKMQMWPTSKTDRQENTREQRERFPVWSPVPPSITSTEITRHQNHLNSSGSLSERPTFQTSRLVSPKSSPADHSSPDLKYWLSHFQKDPGTWRRWCPGQVLPGGGPLTLTPVS